VGVGTPGRLEQGLSERTTSRFRSIISPARPRLRGREFQL
jgi:hypothetical protein